MGDHEFRKWELASLENESFYEATRNSDHEGESNGPRIFNLLNRVKQNAASPIDCFWPAIRTNPVRFAVPLPLVDLFLAGFSEASRPTQPAGQPATQASQRASQASQPISQPASQPGQPARPASRPAPFWAPTTVFSPTRGLKIQKQ